MFDAQSKADTVTHIIAASAVPAPLYASWLDQTGKVAALIYSILGIIWLVKQIAMRTRKD